MIFWSCDYVFVCYIYADTQCYKQSNNKLALVCFILKVSLCEITRNNKRKHLPILSWKSYIKFRRIASYCYSTPKITRLGQKLVPSMNACDIRLLQLPVIQTEVGIAITL